MPRLRQVHTTDAHELAQTLYGMLFGERDPVDEPGTATGSPGDWWTVTALVPDLFDHIVGGFGFYRSGNRLLDPQLRELGQTRTGWARGSRFVYSQHVKACREVGLPEEKIQAIRAWAVADVFSATERAVLAYTDALVLQGGRVPDEVFDALRVELSEEEILELTYIVCTYDMHATMSKALRLEFDDVDDPIIEVPGPEGVGPSTMDAMRVVEDLDKGCGNDRSRLRLVVPHVWYMRDRWPTLVWVEKSCPQRNGRLRACILEACRGWGPTAATSTDGLLARSVFVRPRGPGSLR